ncbi:MAG TPA: KTSC domain-containing protein [Allosphingosinicella sp.]|nr:KTSC domain-containing protein [Allosphingosinicella sp.]
MPAVISSAVDWVEYDEASRTLDIWYNEGERYSYFRVPPKLYEELLAAPSIGIFVNKNIKPFFRYSRE